MADNYVYNYSDGGEGYHWDHFQSDWMNNRDTDSQSKMFGSEGVSEVWFVLTDVRFDNRHDTIKLMLTQNMKVWRKIVFKKTKTRIRDSLNSSRLWRILWFHLVFLFAS